MTEARPGVKARDYWWTVLFTDPVALPLTRLLARTRVLSPDGVTVLALATGLSVGVAFSTGTRAGLVAGALLFHTAFVLDCVDGKLARALGVTSARGEALDHLADGGRRASATLGIALYLWRAEGVPERDVLWAVVYAVLAYYFIEISGAAKAEPAGGLRGRWAAALARRRLLPNPGMPDVQAIAFILGPLSGLVWQGLAAGIALLAGAILLTVWRRLR